MSHSQGSLRPSSGFSSVLKSITKSLKPALGNVPVVINAKVVGGGADMQHLLLQLQQGNPTARAQVANQICEALKKHSISSIPEVWYLARDLCDPHNLSSVRRSGFTLLDQLISQDDDNVGNKLIFYYDLVKCCRISDSKVDPEFDLVLKALRSLTNEGRDIHDLYIFDQTKNIFEFVLSCYKALTYQVKHSLADSNQASQNLIDLTNYFTNCLQYNFALAEDLTITSILGFVVQLGLETTNVDIITLYLELIKYSIFSITTFDELFLSVIEFLCYVLISFPQLELSCLEIVKQFSIDFPNRLVDQLSMVIQGAHMMPAGDFDSDSILKSSRSTHKDQRHELSACLGAIYLLESVFVQMSTDRKLSDVYVAIDQAYDSILDATNTQNNAINSAFLAMFGRLFDKSDSHDSFSATSTFGKLFPFYSWYSSSRSIFSLLRHLKINSVSDRENWQAICDSLLVWLSLEHLSAPKDLLVELFLLHPYALSTKAASFILDYYKEERLCTVMCDLWKGNCQKILSSFLFNKLDISDDIKIKSLSTIEEANKLSINLFDDPNVGRTTILEIFERSFQVQGVETIGYLFGDFLFDFLLTSKPALIKSTFEIMSPMLTVKPKRLEREKSIISLSSKGSGRLFQSSLRPQSVLSEKSALPFEVNEQSLLLLAKTLSRFFITSATSNPSGCIECYQFIIKLLHFCIDQSFVNPLIALLRSLVRLRVTDDYVVYFSGAPDMGGLANAFKRSSADSDFDAAKEIYWEYPETPDYIPVSYLDVATKVSMRNWRNLTKFHEDQPMLDISLWVETAQLIIERYVHWEIYSFVWAHYCSQLSNMTLFEGQESHILDLHKVVCDQLTLHLPREDMFPAKHTSVTKSDLQVAFIRVLSSLLGYHSLFNKADEDLLVNSIIYAMGSYEKTAIPCIHILNICCYEIPLSIKKYLTAILTRLQTSVTSSFASPQTLEFMMSLISLPALTSSFTIDDYKRFFAISFKYIQYASMLKSQMAEEKEHNNPDLILQRHGVDAEVEEKASTQITPITPIMNEYLSLISYKLIARLFLTINLSERRKISPFIMKSLVTANQIEGSDVRHEPIVAFADFLIRFVCSDIPLKVVTPSRSIPTDSNEVISSWILGSVVITIRTNTITGQSTVVFRRPTSVAVFKVELDPAMLKATTHGNGNKRLALNSYFLLQMVNFLDIKLQVRPIPLPDDAATDRALGTLDRTPVVSFHKAGVIYIGRGQTEETDILANRIGSLDYQRFLDRLGKLIRLKDAESIYVGGLDKENGTDGEYAYFWSDNISQTVFHVTTLMPNVASDKYHSFKKRHIGNNHVNIYFDESGKPFNFNVIKSQFNFLNIVITPHTAPLRSADNNEVKVFKVKTFRRHGVPGIFSTTHFKLISAEQLPSFIRNAILISDKFAQVWHGCNNGEYTTNWELRVRQIDALRSKAVKTLGSNQKENTNLADEASTEGGVVMMSAGDVILSDMTDSFLEQLQGVVTDNGGEDQAHAYNFQYPSTGDHEAYLQLVDGSFP